MRKLPYARGVVDIKSIHTAGVRSIPKQLRSPYLDLYILAREKERLGKENYIFGTLVSGANFNHLVRVTKISVDIFQSIFTLRNSACNDYSCIGQK